MKKIPFPKSIVRLAMLLAVVGTAMVALAQPTVNISVTKSNAYEMNPFNEGRLAVTLSAADASDITVNFTPSGTAVSGTDYTSIGTSVTILAGQTSSNILIRPINNSLIDGDRLATVTLGAGAGYTLGANVAASVNIRDDDLPAGTVLYSQNFDADDSLNWATNVTGGDQRANTFFDYSTVGIPAAPNSAGTTRGIWLQANRFGTTGVFPGGVSVSPNGQSFSGNYRLRFDMWCNYNGPVNGGGNGSTLVVGGGVGTAGTTPQVAGTTVDSVFFGATGDGGSGADYRLYSAVVPTSYLEPSGVYAAGTAADARNNSNPYYGEYGPETAPAAQLTLFPAQTGSTPVGAAGFLWRDVLITKLGDSFVVQMDGKVIATATGTGLAQGNNILFNIFDINATQSTDANSANTQFALFDNVRVESINVPTVSISPSTPDASEAGPVSGVYTFTRDNINVGSPLTVNFTFSGTATNGVDYTTIPLSVTFLANETSTNVTLTPINDSISELVETAVLSVSGNANYAISAPFSASIAITDNDANTISITVSNSTAYERIDTDYVTYRLERRGDTNVASYNVNITYSGVAVSGADFAPSNSIAIDPGASTYLFTVSPLDDPSLEGAETLTATVATGSGYTSVAPTSANASIVDDETPSAPILFADPLTAVAPANWKTNAGANNNLEDFSADFGFTLSTDTIPNSPAGSTEALKLSANKNEGSPEGAAGVNVYPIGQSFSNSYAVRFHMYFAEGAATTVSSEWALFGLNMSGNRTNRFSASAGTFPPTNGTDGLWFGVIADASASSPGDYTLHRGNPTNSPNLVRSAAATGFTSIFKNPPFSAINNSASLAGVPANSFGTATPTWADVEMRQIGNVVSLLINNSPILSYTNNSGTFTNGNIMLGYCDPYDSIGVVGAAYYSNLRVVQLLMNITGIQIVGPNVQVDFTWGLDEATSVFNLQKAPAATGTYTNVTTATITKLSPGVYRASTANAPGAAFFRIRR